MKKEIVEIDPFQLDQLYKVLEDCGDGMLKYEGGILRSPGCSGNYGCCSRSIDLEEFVEDIKKQLKG